MAVMTLLSRSAIEGTKIDERSQGEDVFDIAIIPNPFL